MRPATVRRQVGLALAILVVLVAVGWALRPAWFTGYDPIIGVPLDKLQAPSWNHWFGTDHLGRDIFSRMVHGTATSLRTSLLAVAFGLVVGCLLGVVAGYAGGWASDAIMRVVDVLLAIPSLLLSLVIVTVLGYGTLDVAIAVGLGAVATFARLVRAEVVRVRRSAYVEASVGVGTRWPVVLIRHVVPNSSGPVLALAALEIGAAILAVSALSFLGYGSPLPAPEWGSLVAEGRNYLASAWWLTTLPGLVVVALVLAVNRIGRAVGREWGDR
ncbi:ABC transporter permease [Nakamurella sp. YIM 132084]|uniref:ABC transporter permease n=1 Tax=Nakamurella leprariae TaxID=2803911 RepID=A0A939BVP0_9ACTN|nr:ABC transporter permease [Nakamurella leprariae]